jgi:hypothetical protein
LDGKTIAPPEIFPGGLPVDTERKNRAIIDRESGATWTFYRGKKPAARTGSAARHAVQNAE